MKPRKHADRLARALRATLADMLAATDFAMPPSNPEHPFHESVTEARAALEAWEKDAAK